MLFMIIFEYLRFTLLVVLVSFCWSVSWFTLVSAMLYRTFQKKRCFIFCICFIAVHLTLNYLSLFLEPVAHYMQHFWYEPIQFTFQAAILLWILLFRRSENVLKMVSTVALSYFLMSDFFRSIQIIFLRPLEATLNRPNPWVASAALITVYLSSLLFSLGMGFFLRRAGFRKYWGYLFTGRGKAAAVTLLCLLLMHSWRLMLVPWPEWEESLAYSIASIALIFVVVLTLLFLAVFEHNRFQLAEQRALVDQQRSYVQALERLHREVRSFRHDYQNMMAALFLQAEQGDLAGLQKQIRRKIEYFDDNLAEEIRVTGYLANIQIPEVKSLLLVKLQAMRAAGIVVKAEVVTPVVQLGMETEDFVRILGILLDNAAEAGGNVKESLVVVVLLAEPRLLHLSVQNTFDQSRPPSLDQIWQDGYSQKGAGRGTGLPGMRSILDKYENAACRTAVKDGLFTQELVIQLEAKLK